MLLLNCLSFILLTNTVHRLCCLDNIRYVAVLVTESVISMSTIKYLKLLKICDSLLLGGDILLFAFGYKVWGVIVLFSGFIIMWRLYRCPICKHELDYRVSLNEIECCPYCGYDFHINHKGN